jgi:hypothetical protein
MTLDRHRRVAIFAVVVAIFLAGLLALYALYGPRSQVVWQEYRRDDLGFRIEMPGEPTIKDAQHFRLVNEAANAAEERRRHNYGFRADALSNSILFSVQFLYNDTETNSAEAAFKNQRIAFQMLAKMNKLTIDEKEINTNGLRGREFIFPKVNGDGLIARQFALNNKMFVVFGAEGIEVGADNPSVRRFFDSLVLAPR